MAFQQQVSVRFSTDGEEDLIRRVNFGDQTAIETLFHTYYDGLCRFTERMINSKDDVEDLVQNIFVRIWLNKEEWNPKGSIKSYLFKAARNQALNFAKGRKTHEIIEDDAQVLTSHADPAEEMIDVETYERVSEAIEKLPHGCKLVFTLNRHNGLSYSEIADVLGISVKTVENQIARALKLLRKELADLVKHR